MLMYLTMIQDELKGVTADYAELKPQSAGTQGIRQWAPEVGSGDDRYIYIADEKDLKKAETIPSNLIFCSSRTLPELKKIILRTSWQSGRKRLPMNCFRPQPRYARITAPGTQKCAIPS